MAKKRRKKNLTTNQKMSPVKYIIQKARDLDFYKCLINEEWQENGLAIISVFKLMPSGKFIVGLYLTDVYCLGLKNTLYKFNLDKFDYEEFIKTAYSNSGNAIECDTVFAHNLIYGAIDYAEDLGFSPNKNFKITEHLLDPDLISDEINEIEFGNDGQPFFISGPKDNATQIINKLKETVGENNFHYMIMGE